MSYAVSTGLPVPKGEAAAAIDALQPQGELNDAARNQLTGAKEAAKKLVESIPGPSVTVTISGHANDGGKAEPGTSTDFCSITVAQVEDTGIFGSQQPARAESEGSTEQV